MHRRAALYWGRTLLGFGLFFVAGCNLDYYVHLARGQSHVLFNRVAIAELLADPELDEHRRKQFELIGAIRRYAGSIGLNTGDNYTAFYDTGDNPVSWNVSASPPDRFEPHLWNFPIAGAVPYKGFFDLQAAKSQRDELSAAGYDAIVRPVGAYSTLGFFSDPVLSGMLAYTPDQLADLILHELTHATAYAPGHTDFNETMATFVGRRGSLLFLAEHYGADTPLLQRARQRRADSARFRSFMVGTVAALDSLYALNLARDTVLVAREQVFARQKVAFEAIRGEFELSSYDFFLAWEINNARLLSYRRYNYDLERFDAIYDRHRGDMAAAILTFAECAEAEAPWQCLKAQTGD